ncbi:MAG: hypothetical protein AAF557_16295 [Pseudomonadota bacterium]
MRFLIGAALAALMALPAAAEGEFSEGSQAKGWKNLLGREPAVFKAKVVDVLCELSGDCADKCGAGNRQMALLREKDGKLILAGKNAQATFNGATHDLAAYCNQMVTVDGFMVGDPDLTPTRYYMVQLIQREGSDKWGKARRWTRAWTKRNPDLKDELKAVKNRWFRIDPDIMAEIERDGWLGLGAEEDKKFIEENY